MDSPQETYYFEEKEICIPFNIGGNESEIPGKDPLEIDVEKIKKEQNMFDDGEVSQSTSHDTTSKGMCFPHVLIKEELIIKEEDEVDVDQVEEEMYEDKNGRLSPAIKEIQEEKSSKFPSCDECTFDEENVVCKAQKGNIMEEYDRENMDTSKLSEDEISHENSGILAAVKRLDEKDNQSNIDAWRQKISEQFSVMLSKLHSVDQFKKLEKILKSFESHLYTVGKDVSMCTTFPSDEGIYTRKDIGPQSKFSVKKRRPKKVTSETQK